MALKKFYLFIIEMILIGMYSIITIVGIAVTNSPYMILVSIPFTLMHIVVLKIVKYVFNIPSRRKHRTKP